MRVEQIDIFKFRGIDSASLKSCGALNVLIGKNNSGKSTILDAIDAFFAVIASGSLVTDGQIPLGQDSDFHRGDPVRQPIRISVDLSLTSGELEQVVQEIVSEAPQMKNALQDIGEAVRLKVEVKSAKSQREFAYISRIELVRHGETPTDHQSRVIFSLSNESALELVDRKDRLTRTERQATEMIEFGRRIDPDDFQLLKRESSSSDRGTPVRLRRIMASSAEIGFEFENLISHSESFADFRRQLETFTRSQLTAARRAEEEPLKYAVDTFSGQAQAVPAYVAAILKLVSSITVLHLRDRRDPVGREEAQRLLSLKTRRKGPEVLRNIQDTVQSLLGVSIDAFESEKTGLVSGDSRAEMDVDEVLVEMNGAGIREALRLILDSELGGPKLLLVEEPEVHLHPALELSMLRYLKTASLRSQIFVTTHSTNFLDTSEMRNVYLTRRDPWVNATLVDYEKAETAIPEELGIRLSSLFMFDRLVFVEGATDEAVLRELAALVGVNFGQSNLGFVVMGSARNFTHYASEATIELLTKRRVKMFFILDRDEASEAEVAGLVSRLGAAAEVHVLEKREIENYLAVPRALTEFILEKKSLQGHGAKDVSEELVNERLNECAEELRQLAVEKRILRSLCAPVYLDRVAVLNEANGANFDSRLCDEIDRRIESLAARKTEIESLTEREQERVDLAWDKKKLDIVPGDELLDRVCQTFGVRFKKRRDGSRLARLLDVSEVPAELSELLRRLAP